MPRSPRSPDSPHSPRRSVKHTKGDTRVYKGKNQVYSGRRWNTILHCSQCTYTCYTSSRLKSHLLTHTGERPHKCPHCAKAFSDRSSLRKHLFTHTEERPHKCPQCNKAFKHSSSLRKHVFTHTGERPHKCPHCNKAFTQKGALNIHLLTHTGERPHKCPHCDQSFTQITTLNCHLLRHTGEKPHKCPYCNKAFTQKGALNIHLLTHTGERPHKCPHCDQSFKQITTLNCHLLTHPEAQHQGCLLCNVCCTFLANPGRAYKIYHEDKDLPLDRRKICKEGAMLRIQQELDEEKKLELRKYYNIFTKKSQLAISIELCILMFIKNSEIACIWENQCLSSWDSDPLTMLGKSKQMDTPKPDKIYIFSNKYIFVIEVDESSNHEKNIYRLLEIKNRIDKHLNSKECGKCKKKIHISSFSSENGECNECNGLGENVFVPLMEMIVLRINVNEDVDYKSLVTRKQYKDNDNQQISFYYDLNERGESVMTDVCMLMNSLYAQFENDDNMTGNDDKLLIYEVNGDEDIVTEKYLNEYDEDNDVQRYPSNGQFFETEELDLDEVVAFI